MTETAPATDRPAAPPEAGAGGIARSSLVNLVGFGAYGLSNFLLIVVITRRLGTAGAGALLESIAVFSILARSAMLGTDVALVRFTSRFAARNRHGEVRTLYRITLLPVLAVSGAAGLAMFLLAEPLGGLLSSGATEAELVSYLRVMAPFVPLATVYQVIEGGSRGFGTMLPSVVVERIGRSASLPVVVLGAIAAGGGATLVGLAWAGPFALALIPLSLWVLHLLRRGEERLRAALRAGDDEAPEPIPRRELARRVWRFAIPRAFAGVFAFTIAWVDALLLGALEGSEAVGIYSAATRWLIVGNFAGTAVTQAFAPQISRVLATHGPAESGRLFQRTTALFVLLAWPAYSAAMVFAPFLLSAFGDDFTVGARVVAITGAGFLVASAAGPIDMLLLMAGRSSLSLVNTGIALAVNVVANLVLIPPMGIEGAALAWAISLVVSNALPVVQMWRILGIHPWGTRSLAALAITAASGATMLAARALLGATALGLATGLLAGGAVLVAGVLLAPDRMGVGEVLRRAGR